MQISLEMLNLATKLNRLAELHGFKSGFPAAMLEPEQNAVVIHDWTRLLDDTPLIDPSALWQARTAEARQPASDLGQLHSALEKFAERSQDGSFTLEPTDKVFEGLDAAIKASMGRIRT